MDWRFVEQLIHFRAVVLLFAVLSLGLLSVLVYLSDYATWQNWQGGLLGSSLSLLVVAIVFLWMDYVRPSNNLRAWLLDVHAGNLSSRVAEVRGSSFNGLSQDFNSLAHMLEAQADRGEVQVRRHTEHLTDKTRMQERAWIAYELHDSLAQTIGGMRFRVHALEESLQSGDTRTLHEQLEKLRDTLRAANREIRDLIGYFHTTSQMADLEHAVDELILRFRQDNPSVQVFFHKTWSRIAMPREYEVQVLRVIQEALNNVQKHAEASLVRVMIRGDDNGNYRVLVEDNGVGMKAKLGDSAEHIGLDGIRDRASRIGAKLLIESEAGEGVHVVLDFSVPSDRQQEVATADG